MKTQRTSIKQGKVVRAWLALMCLVITLETVQQPANAWFNTVIDAAGGNTGHGSNARSVLPSNYQTCILRMIRTYWSTQNSGNQAQPICQMFFYFTNCSRLDATQQRSAIGSCGSYSDTTLGNGGIGTTYWLAQFQGHQRQNMAEGFYAWDGAGVRHCIGQCRSDPSGSSPAHTGHYGDLVWIPGWNGCVPPMPRCHECQGDCDSDSECAAGLFCQQRGVQDVPSCGYNGNRNSAGAYSGIDFCYRVGGYPTTPASQWSMNPTRVPQGRLVGINYDDAGGWNRGQFIFVRCYLETRYQTGNTVNTGDSLNVTVFHPSSRGSGVNLNSYCPGDTFQLVSVSPARSWITFSAGDGLIRTVTQDAASYLGTFTIQIRHTTGYSTSFSAQTFNPSEPSRIYSSFWYDAAHSRSMLDGPQGWSARHNDANQWLDIDVGSVRQISGVVVQARRDCGYCQWTKAWTFQYSSNRSSYSWIDGGAIFRAPVAGNDLKHNVAFSGNVNARYIRIFIKEWHGHISGCFGLFYIASNKISTLKNYTVQVNQRTACNAIAWNAISRGDVTLKVLDTFQHDNFSPTLVNNALGSTWSNDCGNPNPTISVVSSPSWVTMGPKLCSWIRSNNKTSSNYACGVSTVFNTLAEAQARCKSAGTCCKAITCTTGYTTGCSLRAGTSLNNHGSDTTFQPHAYCFGGQEGTGHVMRIRPTVAGHVGRHRMCIRRSGSNMRTQDHCFHATVTCTIMQIDGTRPSNWTSNRWTMPSYEAGGWPHSGYLPMPTFTLVMACGNPITKYLRDSSGNQPPWIVGSNGSWRIYTTTTNTYVGTHILTLRGIENGSGTKNEDYSFSITITYNPCIHTTLNTGTLGMPASYSIYSKAYRTVGATSQTFTDMQDRVGNGNLQTPCGPKTYLLTQRSGAAIPSAWMTFSPITRTLVMDSRLVAENGTYTFTLRTHLTNWPQQNRVTYYVYNYFTVYIRMLPCLNTIKWNPIPILTSLVKINGSTTLDVPLLPAIDAQGEDWLVQCGRVTNIYVKKLPGTLWTTYAGQKSTGGFAYNFGASYATPALAHAKCISLGVLCVAVVCNSRNSDCTVKDSLTRTASSAGEIMYARSDHTYTEQHGLPAEYGTWSLGDNVTGVLTFAPTNERYATAEAGQKFELRRYTANMADASVSIIDLQIWPEFCLISDLTATVAAGETVKDMKFTYAIGADGDLDLPVPFYQPFPQCNPIVYPETKLVTTFVGDFKGKFRDPFPHLTQVEGDALPAELKRQCERWNHCANGDGSTCRCIGVARFGEGTGFDSKWVVKSVRGTSIACDASGSGFGSDPSPSAVKTCQCQTNDKVFTVQTHVCRKRWKYDGKVQFKTIDKKLAEIAPMHIKIKTCNTGGNVCNQDFSWTIKPVYDKCLRKVQLDKFSTEIKDMEASVGNPEPVFQEFAQMKSTICPEPEGCCGFRNYTIVDEGDLTQKFLKLETHDLGNQKLTLLPMHKKDIGIYDLKVKVCMVKYGTAQCQFLNFKVTVWGCRPASLDPFFKMLRTINYEIQMPAPGDLATLDTQDLKIATATFIPKPDCELDIKYAIQGDIQKWMVYNDEEHSLDLSAYKAVNGTYRMQVVGTFDGSDVTATTAFSVIVSKIPYQAPVYKVPELVEIPEEIFVAPVEVVNLPEVDLSKYTYKQAADKKARDKPFTVKPTPMTDTGEIGLDFSIPARAPKDGKLPAGINDTLQIVFEPKEKASAKTFVNGRGLEEVDPMDHLEDKTHGFSWEVTSFTKEGLKFKFTFKDPLKVSQTNSKPDNISLKLKKDTFFSADPPYKALSGKIKLDLVVPKQFHNKLQSDLSAMIAIWAGTLYRIAMLLALGTHCVVYLSRKCCKGGTMVPDFMKKFWPLYNIMQLVCIISIMDIVTPPNVTKVLAQVKNEIEVDFAFDQAYHWIELVRITWELKEIVIYFGIIVAVMLLSTLAFWGMSKKFVCVYKAWNFFTHMMCWSPPIRLMFITYLYVCIYANYGSPLSRDDFEIAWPNYVAQGYLCAVIAATWSFFYYSESLELTHTATREKWGSLYQGLKTENFYQMLQTIMFFVRRILFIMALQSDIFALKFGGIMFATMIQLCYLLDAKPHQDQALANLERFNDIFFLFMMYILPCFTPYVEKVEIQYYFGWIFLGALAPLFLVNVCYIIISTIGVCISSRKVAIKQGKIDRMLKLQQKAVENAKVLDKGKLLEDGGMIYKRGTAAYDANLKKQKEATSNFFGKAPTMDKMDIADFRKGPMGNNSMGTSGGSSLFSYQGGKIDTKGLAAGLKRISDKAAEDDKKSMRQRRISRKQTVKPEIAPIAKTVKEVPVAAHDFWSNMFGAKVDGADAKEKINEQTYDQLQENMKNLNAMMEKDNETKQDNPEPVANNPWADVFGKVMKEKVNLKARAALSGEIEVENVEVRDKKSRAKKRAQNKEKAKARARANTGTELLELEEAGDGNKADLLNILRKLEQ